MVALFILGYFVIGIFIAYGYYCYKDATTGFKRASDFWNAPMADITKEEWMFVKLFLFWGLLPLILPIRGVFWFEKWLIREVVAPKKNVREVTK